MTSHDPTLTPPQVRRSVRSHSRSFLGFGRPKADSRQSGCSVSLRGTFNGTFNGIGALPPHLGDRCASPLVISPHLA